MKNCRYFIVGILLCLAFYGQPILAEGEDSESAKDPCFVFGLFDKAPCLLDVA